ncbi:MAG: hypothetical protein K6U80_16010 [Firmicutes bacterium]|nr:hypothetical protein [Bacillota bacterium]
MVSGSKKEREAVLFTPASRSLKVLAAHRILTRISKVNSPPAPLFGGREGWREAPGRVAPHLPGGCQDAIMDDASCLMYE